MGWVICPCADAATVHNGYAWPGQIDTSSSVRFESSNTSLRMQLANPAGSGPLQLCYHLCCCGLWNCRFVVLRDSGRESFGAMKAGHSACSRQRHLFVDDWTTGSAALQENDPWRQCCKVLCIWGGTWCRDIQTESPTNTHSHSHLHSLSLVHTHSLKRVGRGSLMDHGRCLLLAVKSSCDLLFLHMYRFCWLMAPRLLLRSTQTIRLACIA